ncbi:Cold-regulated 413 plasma membrane protein 2 [Heracleum sosnowskyi]|uniref:Cold-regulated 413 plasma membrane protein 2 n=1 Tax=Heracleum sosnowskyi TaxID=360622 RepID=A0AAD8HBM4_9APIA|nr:Cold-regulated 413 plasma membrane protein 2 [Heracleum sosnowskyi]
MEMGLSQLGSTIAYISQQASFSGFNHKGRSAFQWGGTISAIFLLILNMTGNRSSKHTSLLVLFLLISFPTALFNILRGEFGCWVASLTVLANLFYPDICPVSRFVIFVVAPDWLADGLRYNIVGGVSCLILGLLLVVMEIQGSGIWTTWECNLQCLVGTREENGSQFLHRGYTK